jgi:anti-sigma factor RsiW
MRRACEPVREIISASLDGEATMIERKRAERHMARCADCRAFARTLDLMIGSVRAAPPLVPMGPPAVAARAGRRRRSLGTRVVAAAAGFAAVAAIGAGVAGEAPNETVPAAAPSPATAIMASIDMERHQQQSLIANVAHVRSARDSITHRLSRLETVSLG